MSSTKKRGVVYIVIAVIMIVAGIQCGADRQGGSADVVAVKPSGTAKVTITASSDHPFSRIAKTAEAVISSPDMITVIAPLTVTDSTIEGVIAKIPAGKNREIIIYVYDQDMQKCYEGSGIVDIFADSIVTTEIDIYRVKGDAKVIGTIYDTIEWRTRNLVLDMPFSGNFRDLSGYFNDGAAYGPKLTSDRFGRPDSACLFDGVDDYLDIPYDSTLDCEDSISIAVWAKSDVPGTDYKEYGAVVRMGVATEEGYGIGLNVNHNQYVMQLEYREHWVTPADTDQASLEAAILDGAVQNSSKLDTTWHFYALTFDGDSLRGYVDSIHVGTKKAIPGNITNTSFTLGMDSKAYKAFWKGKIDDVRVYHRVLTEDEIRRLRVSED